MGYMHIDNLYRNQTIMIFKECYALEKIHGTSAHVSWDNGALSFFSGGEKHDKFKSLFDADALSARFVALGHEKVIAYGEAYGGKCQGMSKTYGVELKFVVFDVKIGDSWLDVPNAHDVATKLALEFVEYAKIPCSMDAIDLMRDKPSEQAKRNGIVEPMIREGVVLRPMHEMKMPNGDRIIAKHKRVEFSERRTIPSIDPSRRDFMEKADAIAFEWVTDMRLNHVLDKLPGCNDLEHIPIVIKAMVEDVTREASGEILDNASVRKAISGRACKMFKARVMQNKMNALNNV